MNVLRELLGEKYNGTFDSCTPSKGNNTKKTFNFARQNAKTKIEPIVAHKEVLYQARQLREQMKRWTSS